MMVRVLNRYVGWDFFKSFLLTVAVLTFVMYIGTVVKAIDYMSRGISGLLIMKIFAIQIPFTLTFVIPMSVLTTVLLHFGRLSADGEITAMKASGISLWQGRPTRCRSLPLTPGTLSAASTSSTTTPASASAAPPLRPTWPSSAR